MLFLAICFIITVVIVGILSGLFGLGGGLTIVPLMMTFMSIYEPAYSSNAMHVAIATSLFVMIFTSSITTYSHHKSNNINMGSSYSSEIWSYNWCRTRSNFC